MLELINKKRLNESKNNAWYTTVFSAIDYKSKGVLTKNQLTTVYKYIQGDISQRLIPEIMFILKIDNFSRNLKIKKSNFIQISSILGIFLPEKILSNPKKMTV
jgi:Ca2+-binding EF-hand superfamily protein